MNDKQNQAIRTATKEVKYSDFKEDLIRHIERESTEEDHKDVHIDTQGNKASIYYKKDLIKTLDLKE